MDPRAEQVAELRDVQVSVDRAPAADLEMVETEFILFFFETLLDRPAGISYVDQPFQGTAAIAVGNKELNVIGPLRIAGRDQPVCSCGQTVALHAELDGLDLADHGAFLTILDMDGRP